MQAATMGSTAARARSLCRSSVSSATAANAATAATSLIGPAVGSQSVLTIGRTANTGISAATAMWGTATKATTRAVKTKSAASPPIGSVGPIWTLAAAIASVRNAPAASSQTSPASGSAERRCITPGSSRSAALPAGHP